MIMFSHRGGSNGNNVRDWRNKVLAIKERCQDTLFSIQLTAPKNNPNYKCYTRFFLPLPLPVLTVPSLLNLTAESCVRTV